MEIVPAEYKDIASLSAFASRIVREHFTPLIGAEQNEYMIRRFQSPEALQEAFESGYRYYWVKDDGKDAGFLAYQVRPDHLYLSKFYTDAPFRGRHLAKKMLDFVIARAEEENRSVIRLNVNKDNAGPVAVYRHLGFAVTSFEKNDIGNGFVMDDYVMEYYLNHDFRIKDGTGYLDEIRQLIIEYTAFLGRDLSFQDLEGEMKDLAAKYSGSQGEILAAVNRQGEVGGCVAYHRHNDSRCEMKRLFVRPQYRRLHIGDMLAGEIKAHAREAGYTEMVLDTIEPLQAAIRLYHKQGFAECGAYYDNPMDDVIYMSCAL